MYHAVCRILVYLFNKCTIYVDNYLFLIELLHDSMFVLYPQGVFNYVC
jgi:hypothetical protein